jgi:putative restriction endonuclease
MFRNSTEKSFLSHRTSGGSLRRRSQPPSLMIDRCPRMVQSLSSLRDTLDIEAVTLRPTEAPGSVTLRRGQDFFRNATLAAYGGRCCATGLPVRELLRASHIIPWAVDIPSRLDPTNGLCLNVLYDATFDRGLMTLDEQYRVVFTKSLRGAVTSTLWDTWLGPYEGRAIELPDRLVPRDSALLFHREHVFAD